MLTKEQRIDMINDLEDNLCTSTLASVARLLIEEKETLQREIDQMKELKRTAPCPECKNFENDFYYCPYCGRRNEEK